MLTLSLVYWHWQLFLSFCMFQPNSTNPYICFGFVKIVANYFIHSNGFALAILKASGAGVCPQGKDWMKGEVLIFSSSVCQRMLKDGFALKTRKWRGTFVSLSFEQRSEKGNDNKKKLLRLKISKKRGASVIQTSQVYHKQESVWNLSIFHQEHISNRVTHWCVFSGGRKSAFERKIYQRLTPLMA